MGLFYKLFTFGRVRHYPLRFAAAVDVFSASHALTRTYAGVSGRSAQRSKTSLKLGGLGPWSFPPSG
jgi:hypothetical protein